MKFCKNLQRVVDIADPEWAPYWTNYKMLKKLIKELPSLVPAEEHGACNAPAVARAPSPTDSSVSSAPSATPKQNHGDRTSEVKSDTPRQVVVSESEKAAAATEAADQKASTEEENCANTTATPNQSDYHTIGKSPGEIAFFKLLHAEFKKATHFFERAQQEYEIREDRVRKGMEIMKQPNSIMVGEKWSLLAKSIYRLYKDLLLLETFAIMTYCGFSKILKKHDKVTGYHTRNAFMSNVVNKANFTNYPKVLEMITRCEQLYEEVSERLIQDGKNSLLEDERLFINMIHRLNEQVIDSVEENGIPERKEARRSASSSPVHVDPQKTTWATSSLRSLVQENEAIKLAAEVVSEGQIGVDSDDDATGGQRKGHVRSYKTTPEPDEDRKRKAISIDSTPEKRPKPSTV